MRVAVAGDWHGNTNWAVGRLMSLGAKHPDVDTLLHLGDFGIWLGQSGIEYLDVVEKAATRQGIRQILVTPGNHEDWGRLMAAWAEPANLDGDGEPLPLRLNDVVTVLPRGHRFEMGGRTFVSIGGAISVDREWRTPGASWWSAEEILPADVERVARRGHADVMLTHDSPDEPYWTEPVAAICQDDDSGWPFSALLDAAVSRKRLREAFEVVQPRLLFHGHFHVRGSAEVTLSDGSACRIESLPHDGMAGNVVLLDLDALTVEEA